MISGSLKARRNNAYKVIYKYITDLKEMFSPIVSIKYTIGL